MGINILINVLEVLPVSTRRLGNAGLMQAHSHNTLGSANAIRGDMMTFMFPPKKKTFL